VPYCPECGKEVDEGVAFCPSCGARLGAGGVREGYSRVGAADHLSHAFNLAMEKPMVFAPSLLGGLISVIIGGISVALFGASGWSMWRGNPLLGPAVPGLAATGALLAIVGGVASYLLGFASIDMSRDAYVGEPLDLMKSVNYVVARIGTFVVASIVGAVMAITVILIPAVIFMFVIIVVDETGIGAAISRAFSVIGGDLGDVVVVIIVAIVGSAVLGWVPLVGGLLTTALNVVIGLAFMDIYFRYKRRSL
jgi:hypothetical protein